MRALDPIYALVGTSPTGLFESLLRGAPRYLAIAVSALAVILVLAVPLATLVNRCRRSRLGVACGGKIRAITAGRVAAAASANASAWVRVVVALGLFAGAWPVTWLLMHVIEVPDSIAIVASSLLIVLSIALLLVTALDVLRKMSSSLRKSQP